MSAWCLGSEDCLGSCRVAAIVARGRAQSWLQLPLIGQGLPEIASPDLSRGS